MGVLTVGKTKIHYTLRRSPTAKRARLTVTPSNVEVVVPDAATAEQIDRVLNRRRAWLVATTKQMAKKVENVPVVSRYVSGAKIPYRGRQMRLRVENADCAVVEVSYRNGFLVRVPRKLPADLHQVEIETALRLWLKQRVRRDVFDFVHEHGDARDLHPRHVRIKDMKRMWGSCGRDGIVNINWHLIFAPKTVLEYAVVHEMMHLRHRDHSPAFWRAVGEVLPDWRERKRWLEQNEHLLVTPDVLR